MAYTTIDDPEAYFQVQLYTGDGSADHAITLGADTDMQPDFVWIKNRDAGDDHCLFDSVRGATEVLHANTTAAEATDADTLDSFTSDGFQVDADVKVNTNAEDYVAWNWKANGTGSANTAGSINTTATSANTTAGFSIVSYTGNGTDGATLGHGLGVVPKMMIIKRRAGAVGDWPVYHTALGATKHLYLNDTDAVATYAYFFSNTEPTSTLFSVGDDGKVNINTHTYIAYIFAEKQGFSKFGSYVANGNADGTFVFCGFKPAFVMFKNSSAVQNWSIMDNKRDGFNSVNKNLGPNTTGAEDDTTGYIDFLSNGFKLRNSWTVFNGSGNTIVFMAFAESPFVNSNGVPNNAR